MLATVLGALLCAVSVFVAVLIALPGPVINLLLSFVLCLPALRPFLKAGRVELGWWGDISIRDLSLNSALLEIITDLLAGSINMRVAEIRVKKARIQLSCFRLLRGTVVELEGVHARLEHIDWKTQGGRKEMERVLTEEKLYLLSDLTDLLVSELFKPLLWLILSVFFRS